MKRNEKNNNTGNEEKGKMQGQRLWKVKNYADKIAKLHTREDAWYEKKSNSH